MTEDNPTTSSHRCEQLNRKSQEIKTKGYMLWTLFTYTNDRPRVMSQVTGRQGPMAKGEHSGNES
jgi:hypothetical protein